VEKKSIGRRVLARAIVAAVAFGAFAGAAFAESRGVAQNSPGSNRNRPPASNSAQTKVADPGVRGGAAGEGGPLPGLGSAERNFYYAAADRFQEIDSVSGTLPGEDGKGLGPRFNLNGCAGCHAFPTVGGSSPPRNPQIAVATLHGAQNRIPSFISADGPVREARFVRHADGTPDGGVYNLFVITGRSDAQGCRIAQPDFAAAVAQKNAIFRIPTPLYGLGLVESIPDSGLEAAAKREGLKSSLGISGHFNHSGNAGRFNHSGNDGTITRFGWKAQNKSLLIFAGEAYNVEQGVTNEAFPNERETDPSCQFNGTPEDATNLTNSVNSASPASDFASDIVNLAAFMRLSAPPAPVPPTPVTTRGRQVFTNIGCASCHVATQTSGRSAYTGQTQASFSPLSDFAVHQMGVGLSDGISQGDADGDEFRTAPLWGLGQRIFLLHDGRTTDLLEAIADHASRGSEANTVISNFNQLIAADKQALLNYLRSL
jgi:CxxC motif-containing protein (DUF1111 family)